MMKYVITLVLNGEVKKSINILKQNKNKPNSNANKFPWQKEYEENLTGTKRAYKPEGSLSSESKKDMKKYESWKY